MKTFYLGPENTFSHQAALHLSKDNLVPLSGVAEIVRSVSDGRGYGVVAFENSVDGPVQISIDSIFEEDVLIRAECILPVSFSLYRVAKDSKMLRAVRSHPVALRQCLQGLPGLKLIESSSTVQAMHEISEGEGAIAPSGLVTSLEETRIGIEDRPAWTRFFLLGQTSPPPSGHDHSSFLFLPKEDRPGILAYLLQSFSLRNINLYAIKSRPGKESLGDYLFYLESAGHIRDTRLADAIEELEDDFQIRFLGSFPSERSANLPGKRRQIKGQSLPEMRQLIDPD